MSRYAGVIVDIHGGELDRLFTYRIPQDLEEQICVGTQVQVPFGTGNRQTEAFVIELTDRCSIPPERLKDIRGICEKRVQAEGDLIRLAWWIKEQYGSSLLQALKTVLPVRRAVNQKRKRTIRLGIGEEECQAFQKTLSPKRNHGQIRLLEAVLETGLLPEEVALEKLHVSRATIRSLETKGILRIEEETDYRNPILMIQQRAQETKKNLVRLNNQQKAIVEEILEEDRKGVHRTYLIHGVTGSGKTQVYMELIEDVLDRGKQAILLIPEISLTYQTVMRFYHRFGDQVSILHSRMSAGERFDAFERAKKGEVRIMIGPRSALFTPFPNLGMILIDEEQESSYKSEQSPRYHAVGVAKERARMASASLILGSATPSVDSYFHALRGDYRLLHLDQRAVEGAALPQVQVIDMREELQRGNKSILSRDLSEKITQRLERREQIILFLNRRGYAGFLSCRACGKPIQCPHCDVSLTLHKRGRLVCHYCGYETGAVKICPSCGSSYVAGFGIGTERVESIVKEKFPEARILRMDADTTGNKGGHEKILSAFSEEQADILIGTQMIVKGHDFPKVTLVGVLAADLSLNSPSYDSGEKTYDLLTQAAGRAGRGNLPGEVLIQTYAPEHYSVTTSAQGTYQEFYEEEIAYRQMLHYPPVYEMMTVLFSSKDEKKAEKAARKGAAIADAFPVERIGPCDASIGKINDIYRKVFYLKCKDRNLLVKIKNQLELAAPWKEEGEVLIQFDLT